MTEIRTFLERHLQSIFDADVEAYHASTSADLTLYEWYITPNRIDGLPFHDFLLSEAARPDSAALALDPDPGASQPGEKARLYFDLANYHEQDYGMVAICSYTMLLARATASGVRVSAYNESRVILKLDAGWKVVHVHKSPNWKAPFQQPEQPHAGF